MVKRFKKNNKYTLCLIRSDLSGELFTWCLNVVYKYRIEDTLLFESIENSIIVNLETKTALISEMDNTPLPIVHITNIVKGWIF